MRLLAFDTSTDTLFLAVTGPQGPITEQLPGGAQASATLIPALRGLLAQAGLTLDTLDALVFGQGPGSFTGLRTACSVAQGLAFGARGGQGLPVLPVPTLLAVAEDARARHGCTQVVAALDARMDELYHTAWQWTEGDGWQSAGPLGLCAPEVLAVPEGWTLAGNAVQAYGARVAAAATATAVPARPDAAALLRLAPALLDQGQAVPAAQALPLYVRDKVAHTTAERAAAKAAQVTSAAAAPTAQA
ncbi:MAG: tRNA (adenosine(37)-N6)-threonylcarbamoyltransferase complex dimerization subunit type 1 TsaB [Burkholderiaceae bacterium]